MAEDKKDNKNIHFGHREKVRRKYYETGFNGMAEHNVLEMLLFFGIPYKDTNPIAHELIERFGSLSAVFEASRTDLQKIKGMTENAACLITMMLPIYKRYSEDLFKRKPTFNSLGEIVDFLRKLYIDKSNNERIYVLCFDGKDSLITYRVLSEGDINSSAVDYRKLASIVLETNASSIIISHNHPHGIALPSKDDIDATKYVVPFMETLKVKVKDHIILTDDEYFSMANSPRFIHVFYNISSPFEDEE